MSGHIPFTQKRVSAEQQQADSEAFLHRMRERRSIRHFSAEPVPLELIQNAILTAASAPSGANQQPWRFVVVSNPALKKQLREAAEAEEKENYARRFPEEWLEALEPFGTDWTKPFIEDAPYVIVVFRIDHGMDGDRKIKHYYVTESVGIATGFLLAALHMAGLSTLTHSPSPMGFLNKVLNRPANERPFILIPVGYAASEATVPDIKKKGLDEVLVTNLS